MVNDQEPRYRLVDADGNVVGSLFAESDGALKLQEGTSGDENELTLASDGGVSASAVTTDRLNTETIGSDDYHYAGSYDGGDADSRLSAAISDATAGDVIFLENTTYENDLTVSTPLRIIGVSATGTNGTVVNAGAWTFNGHIYLSDIAWFSKTDLNVNESRSHIFECLFGETQSITIAANSVGIIGSQRGEITFEAGTSSGLVDGCWGGTVVTDNGNNTLGDIT